MPYLQERVYDRRSVIVDRPLSGRRIGEALPPLQSNDVECTRGDRGNKGGARRDLEELPAAVNSVEATIAVW